MVLKCHGMNEINGWRAQLSIDVHRPSLIYWFTTTTGFRRDRNLMHGCIDAIHFKILNAVLIDDGVVCPSHYIATMIAYERTQTSKWTHSNLLLWRCNRCVPRVGAWKLHSTYDLLGECDKEFVMLLVRDDGEQRWTSTTTTDMSLFLTLKFSWGRQKYIFLIGRRCWLRAVSWMGKVWRRCTWYRHN